MNDELKFQWETAKTVRPGLSAKLYEYDVPDTPYVLMEYGLTVSFVYPPTDKPSGDKEYVGVLERGEVCYLNDVKFSVIDKDDYQVLLERAE